MMNHPPTFSIPSEHPALAGHFPGNPIAPGVLILEHIIALTQKILPNFNIIQLKQIKFHRPLLPEQACHITFNQPSNNILKFNALYEEKIIASGIFHIEDNQ